MKLAFIVPIPNLNLIEQQEVHLILPHLLDVREDRLGDCYATFCAERASRGQYLILDNGADEFSRPRHTFQGLLDIAASVRAHEVVLPDVQQDAVATVELTRRACAWLVTDAGRTAYAQAQRPRLMFVPQGANFTDWCWAYNELKAVVSRTTAALEGGRPVVGIAKNYDARFDEGLTPCLRYIIGESSDPAPIEIHLLGSPKRLQSFAEIARSYGDRIRSLDTARPLVYAKARCPPHVQGEQQPYPGRDDRFFLDRVDEEFARTCMESFTFMATGHTIT